MLAPWVFRYPDPFADGLCAGGRVAAVEGSGPRRAPPRHGAIRPLLLLLPQRAEQRNVGADDGAEHGAYTSHSRPTLS